MKKKLLIIFSLCIFVLTFTILGIGRTYAKEINIDEILKGKEYSSLSSVVKEFIKDYYEENGIVLLTKDLAKTGEGYLNPGYIEYLDSENKSDYYVIPSVIAYRPIIKTSYTKTRGGENLPTSFDLRDVNDKNFVTPNKNQGNEGLCWAYATASLLETHDLMTKDKSYDSDAVLVSEKQMDYAFSSDGIIGGNKIVNVGRKLAIDGYPIDKPAYLIANRLSGYSDAWNTENSNAISRNAQLDPSVVFDRSKALFEADETVLFTNINSDPTDTELNSAMITTIKNIIRNYGGATINVKTTYQNAIRNIQNGNDYILITNKEYFNRAGGQHALHVIGWDDNYEYGFCSGDLGLANNNKIVSDRALHIENNECVAPGESNELNYTKVIGHGVWILKNSWGNDYSYIYLPYDSFIDDIFTISQYSEKNWDDSIEPIENIVYSNATSSLNYHYSFDNDLFDNDTIIKVKIETSVPRDISLYYSPNGDANNLVFIDDYSFDHAGIYTIDLQDRNLRVQENAFFQVSYNSYSLSMFTVFTKKNDNIRKAYTDDYVYNADNAAPTNDNFLYFSTTTKFRNVNDKETITYKIKNSSGEYFPSSAYQVSTNKVYSSIATPYIKISEQYATKGEYTLEAWLNDSLLTSSLIDLKIDYVSIEGSGTQNDPWQIKNINQFNMIRNAYSDNYILMNDLDFEYDTQNPNGAFYNSNNGWIAINRFSGNFDGNNKTIKNVKTSSGLFDEIFGMDSSCHFDECGIHDLKVDNLKYYVKHSGQTSGNGGIINRISVVRDYKYNFDNLSVTNASFTYDENVMGKTQNTEVRIGGIVGQVSVQGGSNTTSTILKIDSWYASYTLNATSYQTYKTSTRVGGLIGEANSYFFTFFSINNAKVNASINITNDNDTHFYVSDLIGAFRSAHEGQYYINNTIGNINYNYNDDSLITTNAFVGTIKDDSVCSIEIFGSNSTLNYTNNSFITMTDSNYNIKPYQIARLNYDDIYYYESQYFIFYESNNITHKVEYKDKYNIFEDKMPTLKAFPEDYSDYYKSYSMRIGQVKSIDDLISNDTNYRNLKVYSSFNCNLDLCDNTTDETVISVPTAENGYTFEGLKSGTTTLVLYDELSGYLDSVIINVLNENQHAVTFDSKGGSSVLSQVVNNNETATRPTNPTKDGYIFVEWQLNGNTYNFNTPVISDITLTAIWQINQYTITFSSNGGSSVLSQVVNNNETATRPTNPTKTGYTFKKWLLNGNEYNFNTPVTSNITLTAEWEINKYTVTFNSNGGNSVATQTVNYNSTAAQPSNPTKTGHTFKEWQLNGVAYNFSTQVTGNITLTAAWIENVVPPNETLKDILEDNNYSVTSNLVSGFTVGMTVTELKNKLGDSSIIVNTSNTIISTGATIKKGNETYTIVIKGDLTGDGRINSGDLLQMRKYLLEEVYLTGAYKQAGIIESNNDIKSLDLLRLRQYLLDEYIIK